MNSTRHLPRLYRDLASWWPVLSAPKEYAEEAAFYHHTIVSASSAKPRTLLELGSGGGNNASHLKKHFEMTLVDLSPGMLEVSRQLNPECEHIQGDMRTVRLGRQFDAIFIHDAIVYMTSERALRRALRTAYEHCKPGGVALFVPDHTTETFKPSTNHGGHDSAGRSMRYLEWTWDPDPKDNTYVSIMVYVLRESGKETRYVHDEHVLGLFPHDEWIRMMSEVGFTGKSIDLQDSEIEPGSVQVFIGQRPQR
jgi:ubiquinone/menaquinone biosynthesis C-methylase UbiE